MADTTNGGVAKKAIDIHPKAVIEPDTNE